jgi:hypothetical protein
VNNGASDANMMITLVLMLVAIAVSIQASMFPGPSGPQGPLIRAAILTEEQ